VRNQTLSGHPFHEGQITRSIFLGANGAIFASTRGTGTNSSRFVAGLNQLAGPFIFSNLDAAAQNYVRSSGICR
jgi:hypothetical protein